MGENVGIDVAKERLDVALVPSGKEFSERNDAGAIKRLVKRINHDLDRAVRNSPLWKERGELISSVPGVGRVLCATLLARLPELGRLNRAEVAALAGVAPFNRDSGTLRGRRMIHGGRARLRTVLYCATVSAVRCNPAIRRFYLHKRTQSKPAKVAIVAAMRKLLVILNAMVKTGTAWSPPCPA